MARNYAEKISEGVAQGDPGLIHTVGSPPSCDVHLLSKKRRFQELAGAGAGKLRGGGGGGGGGGRGGGAILINGRRK